MTDLDLAPSSIRDDSICEPSLNPNNSSGDIVERLRNPVDAWVDTKPRDDLDLSAFIEWIKGECGTAATEIERLRREVEETRSACAQTSNSYLNRALTAESAVAAAREDEREGCALVAENAYTGRTNTGIHPLQIAIALCISAR